MMLGSIPQQDVYQRVMSAKNAPTARAGAVIGGASYILFAFVPMFVVACAVVVMGDRTRWTSPRTTTSSCCRPSC